MSAARDQFRGGPRLSDAARAEVMGKRVAPVPVSAHRRSMLAKVHLAKKELALVEDDYRQILVEETGHASAGDCNEAELDKVLTRLKSIGFKPQKSKSPRAADHPGAGKARAMWISLGQLGAIEDSSEAALEAMARRQLKCDRLQWANQALVYRLIEALKAMAERHGWDQRLDGVKPENRVLILKRRLIDAQMAKLRQADWVRGDWDARRAAYAFGGIEVPSILAADLPQLDRVAQALARAIADARRAGRLK